MRIKLDENLPAELVEDLGRLGHDVDSVYLEGLGGKSDPRIAEVARKAGRVIFTLDKGLGDVRRFPPPRYPGIVLFRFDQKGRGAVRGGVLSAMERIEKTFVRGRLVVVTPRSIRLR